MGATRRTKGNEASEASASPEVRTATRLNQRDAPYVANPRDSSSCT
jgi:hypothetical protein